MCVAVTFNPQRHSVIGSGFQSRLWIYRRNVSLVLRITTLDSRSCGASLPSNTLKRPTLLAFWGALILLGVGWNFGFIGATAMLTETYRPEEKNRVQAVNDFIVFGFVATASLSSGGVLNAFGWETINLIVFPVIATALAVLFFSRRTTPHVSG